MSIIVHTERFNRALAMMLATSRRQGQVVMKEQMKGVMRRVYEVTPPGRAGVSPGKARTLGRQNVKSDALKVVRPVGAGFTTSDVAGAVRPYRRQGRVRQEVTPRIRVPAGAFREYVREKQKLVGFLASGWNEAGGRLGVKPAAWIWSNDAPGAILIEVSAAGIRIVATNNVAWATTVSNLRSRLQWAVNQQERTMLRRLANFQHQAALQAGFKS